MNMGDTLGVSDALFPPTGVAHQIPPRTGLTRAARASGSACVKEPEPQPCGVGVRPHQSGQSRRRRCTKPAESRLAAHEYIGGAAQAEGFCYDATLARRIVQGALSGAPAPAPAEDGSGRSGIRDHRQVRAGTSRNPAAADQFCAWAPLKGACHDQVFVMNARRKTGGTHRTATFTRVQAAAGQTIIGASADQSYVAGLFRGGSLLSAGGRGSGDATGSKCSALSAPATPAYTQRRAA